MGFEHRPCDRHFGLKLSKIQRLTWASTDLSDWSDHAVVILELAEGQDAAVLRALGEPLDFQLGGVACRRPKKDSPWRHPFVILNQRTLVTGREDLLRQLADRNEPAEVSPAIEQFLKTAAAESDLLMAVDLAAARGAGWRLPDWRMDVWPAGRDAWRNLGTAAGAGRDFSPRRSKL